MPRVTITIPDKTPQPYRFQLDRQVVTIGRGSENDIAVDCGSISVKHAEMLRIEGGYELRDVGSTNGIKLDGIRCDVIPLRNGASVKLGDVSFDFQLTDEESEALRREKVLDETPASRLPPLESAAGEPAVVVMESTPKKRHADASADGRGFTKFVLLLLFTLVVFFAGLSIRHYQETGGSLLHAIQSKTKTLKANRDAKNPPAPAPSANDAAAPTTPAADPSVPSTPAAPATPATPATDPMAPTTPAADPAAPVAPPADPAAPAVPATDPAVDAAAPVTPAEPAPAPGQ